MRCENNVLAPQWKEKQIRRVKLYDPKIRGIILVEEI